MWVRDVSEMRRRTGHFEIGRGRVFYDIVDEVHMVERVETVVRRLEFPAKNLAVVRMQKQRRCARAWPISKILGVLGRALRSTSYPTMPTVL